MGEEFRNNEIEATPLSFEEKMRELEQENALEYLKSEAFHDDFIRARSNWEQNKTTESAIPLAQIQINYINALRDIAGPNNKNFKDDDELRLWDARVKHALFDNDNPDSMSSKARSQIKFEGTRSQFVGATSVLTFMNLWQELYPETAKVKMVVADAELDAYGKIDLVVDTDEGIRLIQLKASSGDEIQLYSISEEKSRRGDKVSERHTKKMLNVANIWKKHTGRNVEVIVAEVPGVGSRSIGNVFGKPLENREGLIYTLQTRAMNAGITFPVPNAA